MISDMKSIKDVLKAEYNNFVTFSKSIMTMKKNDIMNLSAITQS